MHAKPTRRRSVVQPDSNESRSSMGRGKRKDRQAAPAWQREKRGEGRSRPGEVAGPMGWAAREEEERRKLCRARREERGEKKKEKHFFNLDNIHLNSNLILNSTELRQKKQSIATWMQDKNNFIYFKKQPIIIYFSYTKFPVKRIKVGEILKLCENYCFIFTYNHILKFNNFRLWQNVF